VQGINESGIVAAGLAARGPDPAHDFAEPVERGQQRRDHGGVERELAVADPAEKGLARMRDLFEPLEGKEAAAALDGVERAEDVADDPGVRGRLLQPHQFLIKQVKVLPRLHEEVLEDFFQLFHGRKGCEPTRPCKHPAFSAARKNRAAPA
jgi:hypothetical protein